jgi:hypothetical protein
MAREQWMQSLAQQLRRFRAASNRHLQRRRKCRSIKSRSVGETSFDKVSGNEKSKV